MTAQVAIFNRSAVALASDSAVTITGQKTKIYQTVNKIFTLSKFHPIGVLVYGNATLLEVPWESIIKLYRNAAGDRRFDLVEEYAQSLLDFLAGNETLFPASVQKRFVRNRIRSFVRMAANQIKSAAQERLKVGPLSREGVEELVTSTIASMHAQLADIEQIPCFQGLDRSFILGEYDLEAAAEIADAFGRLPVPNAAREQLLDIAAMVFLRDLRHDHSGIVVVGFGHLQVFPAVLELHIDCIVGGRPRFRIARNDTVSREGTMIVPFAQRAMVDTFMMGVSPDYRDFVRAYLTRIFSSYHRNIAESIEGLTEDQKQALTQRLIDTGKELLKDLHQAATSFGRVRRVGPMLDTVAVLPKEELAEMAEALVNLTSFEQRMAGAAETVGGPIDVAVISKGDGLVWIKRKHYFRPELNPYFLANYFRQSVEGVHVEDKGWTAEAGKPRGAEGTVDSIGGAEQADGD